MKKRERIVTLIGKDTTFEGNLEFEGTIRIDGHFKGAITSGEDLIVGEEGIIEADMHISYTEIRGEIHGDITAEHRVDILAPGKVFGDIQAPAVVIDEGVIFEGTTRMYRAKSSDVKNKSDPVEIVEYVGAPPSTITAVYGIVTDQETGAPIRNAEIDFKGPTKRHIKTNASGYYEQISLKDGTWILTVKAQGYKKVKTKVVITEKKTYEQNIAIVSRSRRSAQAPQGLGLARK